jgi:hypothetical protein
MIGPLEPITVAGHVEPWTGLCSCFAVRLRDQKQAGMSARVRSAVCVVFEAGRSQWIRLAIRERCRWAEVIGFILSISLTCLPLVKASVRKRHRENRVTLPVYAFQFSTPTWPCRLPYKYLSLLLFAVHGSGSLSSPAATLTTPDSPHRQNIVGLTSPLSATTYSGDPSSIFCDSSRQPIPNRPRLARLLPHSRAASRPLIVHHRPQSAEHLTLHHIRAMGAIGSTSS